MSQNKPWWFVDAMFHVFSFLKGRESSIILPFLKRVVKQLNCALNKNKSFRYCYPIKYLVSECRYIRMFFSSKWLHFAIKNNCMIAWTHSGHFSTYIHLKSLAHKNDLNRTWNILTKKITHKEEGVLLHCATIQYLWTISPIKKDDFYIENFLAFLKLCPNCTI